MQAEFRLSEPPGPLVMFVLEDAGDTGNEAIETRRDKYGDFEGHASTRNV